MVKQNCQSLICIRQLLAEKSSSMSLMLHYSNLETVVRQGEHHWFFSPVLKYWTNKIVAQIIAVQERHCLNTSIFKELITAVVKHQQSYNENNYNQG